MIRRLDSQEQNTLDKFLVRSGMAKKLAPMLSVQDLARLCAACPSLQRLAQEFILAAMKEQHGLVLTCCSRLGALRVLQDCPTSCSLNFRRPATHFVIKRQNAACEYARRADVRLRRGRYFLKLHGWRNPIHGKLTLFLDGSLLNVCNFNGPRMECHTQSMELEILWTGTHQVLVVADQSNAFNVARHRKYSLGVHSIGIEAVE